MKLTGAAILVSRGMKVLQAAPAAYPFRSAARQTGHDMRHIWKRWWFWTALTPIFVVLSVVAMAHHYRVYSWDGLEVYQAMEKECHPAWRDFNFRRVNAGDSVEDVIARTNPLKVSRDDRWVVLGYRESGSFTGMTAVAYDGKMIFACARSCCWTKVFFDEMSDEQSLEFFGYPKDHFRRLGAGEMYR
jgi:hypothetical protein